MKRILKKVVSGIVGLLLLTGSSAMAAQIDWNTWTSGTTGLISTASGPIVVTFNPSGTPVYNYPSYTPTATFADGVIVDNAPTGANGIMQIYGGTSTLNALTFSQPVLNPVFAIWSLGQNLPGISPVDAAFVFETLSPITFVAGGSNAEYGGTSIVVDGNEVSGKEGNGTIKLVGTFTELSWTNPTYEYWYGFNVGAPAPVPEPGTVLLLGAGMAGLVLWRKRRTN